jgi:hypothetical protein
VRQAERRQYERPYAAERSDQTRFRDVSKTKETCSFRLDACSQDTGKHREANERDADFHQQLQQRFVGQGIHANVRLTDSALSCMAQTTDGR